MARILKSCMQSILKGVNLIMGMVGIAMILYGFWMVRVWQRDMGGSPFDDFNSTAPCYKSAGSYTLFWAQASPYAS
ncbi:hypothetical protein QQP08_019375 [Theobroma cacao]|nr:hypothetical protein QQP08_019375 [Theobroma cacao]